MTLPRINSWPTAIVAVAFLLAVSGGVYLERANLDVQHAVAAVLVTVLGLAGHVLPALLGKGEPVVR